MVEFVHESVETECYAALLCVRYTSLVWTVAAVMMNSFPK